MYAHKHLQIQQTLDPNTAVQLRITVNLASQPDQAVVTVSLKGDPLGVPLAIATVGYGLDDRGMAELSADMFGWLLAARNELSPF